MPELDEDELALFEILADRAPVTDAKYIIPKLADATKRLLAEVERLRANVTAGRLTHDISADLRDRAAEPLGPLASEAANQLDELVTLLAKAETARDEARADVAEGDRALMQVIAERDAQAELLDRFVAAVSELTGDDFGEHSNANDPVPRALWRLTGLRPTYGELLDGFSRLHDQQEEWRRNIREQGAEIEQLRGERDDALRMVLALTGTDACRFDGHGKCQEHGWLADGQCPKVRAESLMSAEDGGEPLSRRSPGAEPCPWRCIPPTHHHESCPNWPNRSVVNHA